MSSRVCLPAPTLQEQEEQEAKGTVVLVRFTEELDIADREIQPTPQPARGHSSLS